MTLDEKIKQQIEENTIVLYMKGTPDFPQCGFSAKAVQLLKMNGAKNFLGVNILEDPELRSAIKIFSDWPTIPQLYVQGKFIGGSDILTEMHENGELKELIDTIA